MLKKELIILIVGCIVVVFGLVAYIMRKNAEKHIYTAEILEPIQQIRKMGFYEKYIKRVFDVTCASAALICFSPLYIVIALLVRVKIGSPIIFKQERPGIIDKNGKETIFTMYKFRTMTDERDENGNLLPDDVRLTTFGAWLRQTSLDELPEVFNIMNNSMSLIGPRPQLVRDLAFFSTEQRLRHTAKPGLSGLAQVNGRNAIKWEDKLQWDLKYIEKITFWRDIKIIFQTVIKAFIKQEGITDGDMATAYDYGDWLLKEGKISKEEYNKKQEKAREMFRR